MTVRPIEPRDHPAWAEMRQALWPDCPAGSHAEELDALAQLGVPYDILVAEEGGGLVGFVEVSLRDRVDGTQTPRVGYVEGWYVRPEWRKRGVGRALIEAAEAWTRAHGLTELASDAELENPVSIEAHAAVGFRETARVVQFVKRVPSAASQ